jgi:hypothetical protein
LTICERTGLENWPENARKLYLLRWFIHPDATGDRLLKGYPTIKRLMSDSSTVINQQDIAEGHGYFFDVPAFGGTNET